MPTTTPKTKRESWLDWVPPEGREDALLDAEPLLTRDEFITELKQDGIDVSARDLVYWQTIGVIPYPDRRRHKGATRAVYPQWMLNTVHLMKSLQEQGYRLKEIGPLLRGDTHHRFTPETPRHQRGHDRRAAKRALFPLIDELEPRLRSLARIHERLHPDHVRYTYAEVHLIDAQGNRKVTLFPVADAQGSDEVDASYSLM